MSRIPTHTVEDAPAASRPLLQKIVEATPMGRPAILIASRLAEMNGWTKEQVTALRTGTSTTN